nr:MAG: hypothetical protein H1RhizoLitter3577_000002 [Mitovirus sp.]
MNLQETRLKVHPLLVKSSQVSTLRKPNPFLEILDSDIAQISGIILWILGPIRLLYLLESSPALLLIIQASELCKFYYSHSHFPTLWKRNGFQTG